MSVYTVDLYLSCSGQRAGFLPSPADASLLQHVLFSLLVVFCCFHVGSQGQLGGREAIPFIRQTLDKSF